MKTPLTVGVIRRLIAGQPDDARVLPDWGAGHEPAEHEPFVELLGAEWMTAGKYSYLSITVRLISLEEIEAEENRATTT